MIRTIGRVTDDTEPSPDGGFGALRTAQGNLPLRAMDVRASIIAMIAGVEIVQEFTNPFGVPLEATYIFPLPDRGAVTALRMEAGGRVVDGVLAERAQARRDYEAAIKAGQRAAIAEEDRPDVFTMAVGNIPPGEQVVIRLAITQPLPYEDGEITFRFPLVVAPRFVPGSPLPGRPAGSGVAPDTDAAPDASRISPPVLLPGFPSPVMLSVTADIDPAGFQLAQIRSSLHAVTDEGAARGHIVVRMASGERLDRDFILRLAVADPDAVTGSLVLAPDDHAGEAAGFGTGTFALTLVPPATVSGGAHRDVVIVLDRSGSMGGWKMVAARRAAARIIDTLGAADRFAALCFDNDIEQPPELADRLVAGTDRNRFRAVEFLAGMSARGGTNMLPALERAVDLLSAGHDEAGQRQRVLVLVTDGQVGNEDQILSMLGPRLAGARVHVVGIDQAVNAGFLARLAAIGRGRCELVESQDRLDDAAARIHQRIMSPLVTGLTMHSAELHLVTDTTAPARLPDLFAGAPVTIFGRFDGACPAQAAITVRGVSADGGRYEQVLTGVRASTPATTAAWARAFLRELEDSYSCLAPGQPAELERMEHEIVAVSLRFGVLCRFTAFLAVDTRVVTDGADPHRVIQPVELPAGWRAAAAPVHLPRTRAVPLTMAAGGSGAAGGHQLMSRSAAAGSPAPGSPGPARPAPGWAATGLGAPGTAASGADVIRSAPAVPDWVVAQISGELDWLNTATDAPAAMLTRDLADLGSRLEALITWFSGSRVSHRRLPSLSELAAKLRACDGGDDQPHVAELADEARRVLREFLADVRTGSQGDPYGQRGGAAGRTFWKRARRKQ